MRADIYSCTNSNTENEEGNKQCFSGTRKKIFDICGSIEISETQTGGLCEGKKNKSDGAAAEITNNVTKTSDETVSPGGVCPPWCCPSPGGEPCV